MTMELNDEEWLLARERGDDVSHIPAPTREAYRQLDRLIDELPAHAPTSEWKQRVFDALDEPPAYRDRRRPRWRLG